MAKTTEWRRERRRRQWSRQSGGVETVSYNLTSIRRCRCGCSGTIGEARGTSGLSYGPLMGEVGRNIVIEVAEREKTNETGRTHFLVRALVTASI